MSTQAEGSAKTSSLNDDAPATREPAIIRRYSSMLEKRNLGTHMRAKTNNNS
jgi:hypothetical protein